MKPINILAAATALLMAATPSFAANWVYIGATNTGTVFYVDTDTMKRDGNLVTVWVKWDHSRDKTFKLRETKSRFRFDCAERTVTLLTGTEYYPDGKYETFVYETYRQTAEDIIPETGNEATLEAVCEATAP